MGREGVLAVSDGRYMLGADFSVSGVRDPIVWNVGLQYRIGLPKAERFYTSWQPGVIQLSAGFTDLFNDRFGFSLGVYQTITLPQIHDGEWQGDTVSTAAFCRLEFLVLFEKGYVRAVVNAYAYPQNRPVVFELVYGRTFGIAKN
jgi:hypothetical protein